VSNMGQLFTCGAGWCGRLGHGNDEDLNLPKRVRGDLLGAYVTRAAGEHRIVSLFWFDP
jgi:hypothetical protein